VSLDRIKKMIDSFKLQSSFLIKICISNFNCNIAKKYNLLYNYIGDGLYKISR